MRRRKTGASFLPGFLAAALLFGASAMAEAGQRARGPQPYALIAGTVFREDGLSLRGARVVLEPQGEASRRQRLKKQEALSDARGEFAFRVPPVPSEYLLTATAPGYQSQERKVQVQGEERIDVFFRLARASKN
jgi:hypothetical protein